MVNHTYIREEVEKMKRTNHIPWNEKTVRQKVASVGTILGIFLTCTIIAYAVTSLLGSKSASINNTKGHTFKMDLVIGIEGIEVVPGTEQSLSSITVQNKSSTDTVYAFISFNYDPNVYEIQNVSGWELVQDSGGQAVYSYSSGGAMNEVDIN